MISAPAPGTLAAMALAAAISVAVATPSSSARGRSNDQQMLLLAPETRLEQRCNARAMGIIGREHRDMRPDEFVAYAFADTQIRASAVRAPGAALRSRGAWYHVSYACQTGDDGLTVLSFSYVLGPVVPKKDWAQHYLVP